MLKSTKKITLTKDAKHWHSLWSSWVYFFLMAVTALEGASQFVSVVLPAWQGLMTQDQYLLFVAISATIQQAARFIKQHKLTEDDNAERKTD